MFKPLFSCITLYTFYEFLGMSSGTVVSTGEDVNEGLDQVLVLLTTSRVVIDIVLG